MDRGGKIFNEEILFENLGKIRYMVSTTDVSLILTTDNPERKLSWVVPND